MKTIMQIVIDTYVKEFVEKAKFDDKFWDDADPIAYDYLYVPKWLNTSNVYIPNDISEFEQYVNDDKIIEVKINKPFVIDVCMPKHIKIKYDIILYDHYFPINPEIKKYVKNGFIYLFKLEGIDYKKIHKSYIEYIPYNETYFYKEYEKNLARFEIDFFEKSKYLILNSIDASFIEFKEKYPLFFELLNFYYFVSVEKNDKNDYYFNLDFYTDDEFLNFRIYHNELQDKNEKIKYFFEKYLDFFTKKFFEKLKYKIEDIIKEKISDIPLEYKIEIKQLHSYYTLIVSFFNDDMAYFNYLSFDLLKSQNYENIISNFLDDFYFE